MRLDLRLQGAQIRKRGGAFGLRVPFPLGSDGRISATSDFSRQK